MLIIIHVIYCSKPSPLGILNANYLLGIGFKKRLVLETKGSGSIKCLSYPQDKMVLFPLTLFIDVPIRSQVFL